MPTVEDDDRLKQLLFDDDVRRATAYLSDDGRRLPSDKEIAEHLKVGVRKVRASPAFHDRVQST
jgi:Sigma-70 region 3